MTEAVLTDLSRSVLTEIAAALSAFCRTGEPAAIDLRSLPLSGPDRAALDSTLGRGGVEAVASAGGESEVWETAYSGVWWTRHFDGAGRVVAERIEITAIPDILPSHGADITAAEERLRHNLQSTQFAGGRKELTDAL